MEVDVVVRPSIDGSLPKAVVGLNIPARGVDLSGTVLVNSIIVTLVATVIGFPKCSAHALLCHIDTPINSVKVKMIVTTTGVRLSHCRLGVATPDFANHGIVRWTTKGPRIVLRGPKIKFVELLHTLVFEHGIMQIALSIFATKKDPKGMLWIIRASTVSASDSKSRTDLKSFTSVWVN